MRPRRLRDSAGQRLVAAWYASRLTPLATLLLPAALAFAAASAVRRTLYRIGVLRSLKVGVPVVVVGNLTVGGTGKTPLVRYLVRALHDAGMRPGVVSRGYGADVAGARLVDADDPPDAVGDEPLLYAADGWPVAIGADRVAAARLLRARHRDIDVIVADDGLQHYRLARDFEIAVVDAARRFGNGLPLPAGPLREPVGRLSSVDAVVCNGGEAPIPDAGSRPVFAMRLVADRIRSLVAPSRTADAAELRAARPLAVAGIGNPAQFFATLSALGIEARCVAFPDHHRFVPDDFPAGAGAILVTEKDAVKCRAFADSRFWVVPVSARVEPPLASLVEERLRGLQAA